MCYFIDFSSGVMLRKLFLLQVYIKFYLFFLWFLYVFKSILNHVQVITIDVMERESSLIFSKWLASSSKIMC